MTAADVGQVWRDEWGRVLALLVAQYRRLDLAEDGLADAFEAATRTWPRDGVPANPPAWLLTAARRRVVDRLRAEAMAVRKVPLLVVEADVQQRAHAVLADPGGLVPDERLRLLLLCAHPVAGARGGVRAQPPPGARRVHRGRRPAVPDQHPDDGGPADPGQEEAGGGRGAAGGARRDRPRRAGRRRRRRWPTSPSPPATPRAAGPTRCASTSPATASGSTRVARELLPGRSRLQALLALMLLQHSRRDARVDRSGAEPALVLLPDQDRDRWHHDEIAEGLQLLRTVLADPGAAADAGTRELTLQAMIAAEHATAATADATRWDRIAAVYAELEALTGSAVVRLNRAVAVAEDQGPRAGLALLEGLDEALPTGHRLPATRAALLARAGDAAAARTAYDVAIARCGNESESRHLVQRA